MLANLHVKNLALIEEADINFKDGLNILTGETGAGKSILIDAIQLIRACQSGTGRKSSVGSDSQRCGLCTDGAVF